MSDLRTERQVMAMAGANIDGAREKDDFYPTPPEMTHALLSVEQFNGGVWEPACGDGAISRELESAGIRVSSTDLVDRGYGQPRRDFLFEHAMAPDCQHIITNPPFKLGEQFWAKACDLAPGKVAFGFALGGPNSSAVVWPMTATTLGCWRTHGTSAIPATAAPRSCIGWTGRFLGWRHERA